MEKRIIQASRTVRTITGHKVRYAEQWIVPDDFDDYEAGLYATYLWDDEFDHNQAATRIREGRLLK